MLTTSHTGHPPSIEDKLAEWEAEREVQPGQRNAVYVSAPITTGKAFIAWRRGAGRELREGTPEFVRAHRAEVVLPNTQRAARLLELLRWRHVGLLIDPTAFDVPGWNQYDYHRFWLRVIERHVRRVIYLDGWEYSTGCSLEFQKALELALDCVDERLEPLTRDDGLRLLRGAVDEIRGLGLSTDTLEEVARDLTRTPTAGLRVERRLFKDEVLDRLAHTANVAQFVSFAPGPTLVQRLARVRGFNPNHRFVSVEEAVRVMLGRSPEGLVNIRSFDPARPEGNPFHRRLETADAVLAGLRELGVERGLYTIVNETIDESDGGVSGVSHRGLLDFAPDATPRCVDELERETCALPFEFGMRLLRQVYGFEPDLRGREGARVEFSIHPRTRGWLDEHTVIWQLEQRPGPNLPASTHWPNDFSRLLGDKAFGLALAAAVGLNVPRTLAVSRRLFPWTFGRSTGTGRAWTRTCPAVKVPGYYPSARGWTDPYAVLEDPWILEPHARPVSSSEPVPVVSVLVQEEVHAVYSGRAKPVGDTDVAIHGVSGEGDKFMLGDQREETLPAEVVDRVRGVYSATCTRFGRVEIEWVFDGRLVWIVQMNAPRVAHAAVEANEEIEWMKFRFVPGAIEEFRREVSRVQGTKRGIVVIGNVSPLSHLGEIAELHNVPVRFVRN